MGNENFKAMMIQIQILNRSLVFLYIQNNWWYFITVFSKDTNVIDVHASVSYLYGLEEIY